MERLTFVDEDGQVLFDNPAGFPEDVGFTIRELAKNEEWEALDNIAQRLANCEQRLKYYKDLEEQNRLIKLPCAVGDEFYCIWRNKGQNPIQKMQVKKIEIHERKGIVIQMEFVGNRGCLFRFYEDDFGKTVFLTREEAEAALNEISDCMGGG